ncbi:MAG: stage 0 sporulation family protein [Oscillospiraceae bacterium]|nr:stage 0 sporulation family protein [Oscillospiraceae bacterium]
MTEIVSIRFKNKGKTYFFAPNGNTVTDGDPVIVETSKGPEYAVCTWGNHWVDDSRVVPPLRPVLRVANEEDRRRFEQNEAWEAEAFRICQEKIAERGMDMKLVDVEYSFDGSKILFFFTSEGRVDFRELVKDLAGVFHTRIELRQIGVRDEAKMLGGLGICGRPFCCRQFMDDFHPVSIKMAKTQGLSLNPAKISGTCGRLMCCLKYEQVAYEDLVKQAPKVDAFVDTPGGKGTVVNINLLRGYAKVRLEDSGDTIPKTYPFDELEILGGKARRAEYIAARDAGRLEEAGFAPSRIRRSRLEEQPQPKREEDPFVFADGTVPEQPVPEEPRPEKPSQGKTRRNRNRNRRGAGQGGSRPEAAGEAAAKAAPEAVAGKNHPHAQKSHQNRHRSKGGAPREGAKEQRPKNAGQEPGSDTARQAGAKPVKNRNFRRRHHGGSGGDKKSGAPQQ